MVVQNLTKGSNRRDLLILLVLLFFSGNPLITYHFGKFTALISLLLIVIFNVNVLKVNIRFARLFLLISVFLTVIFVLQFLHFDFVSIQGVLNFFLKIAVGGFVIWRMGDLFPEQFFKSVFFISIVSLFCFVFINVFKMGFPSFETAEGASNYIIYHTTDIYFYKNHGMFWEPGAFAGIITLCLALNIEKLGHYWRIRRFELLTIILALISTQSTTGYLAGFLILLICSLRAKSKLTAILLLPVLTFLAFYLYTKTDFLEEKIEGQFETALENETGDFSNTRFGSIIFDWHYIQKHPVIGNGLHESTRYADHQFLFDEAEGDAIGSGNGFSHFMASMGIFFIVGYFVLIYKAVYFKGPYYYWSLLAIVLLNLQGEQWFNFSLYLALPFLNYKFLFEKRMKNLNRVNSKPDVKFA